MKFEDVTIKRTKRHRDTFSHLINGTVCTIYNVGAEDVSSCQKMLLFSFSLLVEKQFDHQRSISPQHHNSRSRVDYHHNVQQHDISLLSTKRKGHLLGPETAGVDIYSLLQHLHCPSFSRP